MRFSRAPRPIFLIGLVLSIPLLAGANGNGCGPGSVVIGNDTGGGSTAHTGSSTTGAGVGGSAGSPGSSGGSGGSTTPEGTGGTGGCIPGTGGSGCYGGGCVVASTTPVESEPLGADWLEAFNLAGSAYTCKPGNAGELPLVQCQALCPSISVTNQLLQQCSVEIAGPNGGAVECRYSDCGSPCAFH